MSRKRRLKKLEKRVAGLTKTVSRIESGIRKTTQGGAGSPAKRARSANRTDTVTTPAAPRTTGRHATTARKAIRHGAPTAHKATGKRAKRSHSGALSALPS
jgi:hypothetical protein